MEFVCDGRGSLIYMPFCLLVRAPIDITTRLSLFLSLRFLYYAGVTLLCFVVIGPCFVFVCFYIYLVGVVCVHFRLRCSVFPLICAAVTRWSGRLSCLCDFSVIYSMFGALFAYWWRCGLYCHSFCG